MPYVISCFVGTKSSPQWGTQCAKLTKLVIKEIVRAQSSDDLGQLFRLVGVTGVKSTKWGSLELKVSVKMFPQRCLEGLFLV